MRRFFGVLLLIGVLLLSALPTFAAGGPVRVAVLSGDGDRAVDEATLVLLEVALTENKEVALLERAQVRKILAEQKLSAAGLTDPATAVRLGKLLSVEMFLFLDRIPKSQPPICRGQVIETQTGIVLDGTLMEESSLGQAEGELGPIVRRALAKQQSPLADRRYAAILGLRNEEPGQALDGLARTLWMLLSVDLQECPSLILLDREHLQRLREEKQLTDVEQALKLSTVLLEGGIRRSAEQGKVEMTLLLQPLAGGEPERLALRFDPAKIESFRRELVAAITERLKLKPPSQTAVEPEKEGRRFLAQSGMLASCGESDAAMRAVEAAYTLWPDRSTRLALAGAYAGRVVEMPDRFRAATEAQQVEWLMAKARELSLLYEQYRSDFAPVEPEKMTAEWRQQFHALHLSSAPRLPIITVDGKGEAASVQQDVAELQRKLLDTVIEATRRDPKTYESCYWETLSSIMSGLYLLDMEHAAEKAVGVKNVFDLWCAAPNGHNERFRDFGLRLQGDFNNSLQHMREPAASEARKCYAATFKSFIADQDPWVRFTADYGLLIIDTDATDAAESVLKYIRDDLDWNQFTMGREGSLGFVAYRAVETVGVKSPALAIKYCEQIIGPWMKDGGDAWRVAGWYMAAEEWTRVMEKAQGKAEADALYGRLIAALRNCSKRWPDFRPAEVGGVIRQFEDHRARLAVSRPASPGPGDPWGRYEIRPLNLKLAGAADAVIIHNGRLYCILCKQSQVGQRTVTISTHKFAEGGPALRTVTLTVAVPSPSYFDEVWPVFLGDRLYVGTAGGLVTLTDTEAPRLMTEADGLPSTNISAMDVYEGKLYLALGRLDQPKHAFAIYDPAAKSSRVIFSNTAIDETQRRDLPISVILADKDRKCLWLGGRMDGLWRYDPTTDKTEKMAAWRFGLGAPYAIHTMAFCPGGLLYISASGLSFVDLRDFKQLYLAGSVHGGPNGPDDKALFSHPGDQLWPAWYDGTTLITAGAEFGSSIPPTPFLHQVGMEPTPNRALRGLRLFEPTPDGLLAMDSQGDGYLIRKKPGALGKTGAKP